MFFGRNWTGVLPVPFIFFPFPQILNRYLKNDPIQLDSNPDLVSINIKQVF